MKLNATSLSIQERHKTEAAPSQKLQLRETDNPVVNAPPR